MRRFLLPAASLLIMAAAPSPTLREDARCLYETIDPPSRDEIGISMATGAPASETAEKSLSQAMEKCGSGWPQERLEVALTYSGSRMMFERAGGVLAAAGVNPELVIDWFDAQPADRRTSMFAKGGDEAADARTMADAIAFLRSKGVPETGLNANMEPLAHAIAALVMAARMKAGLPL